MTDFLIVEDEDMDFVWKTIQDNRLFSIQTLPLKGNSTTPSFLHPRERNRLFCL